MQAGIVGLPYVGKSALYASLAGANAPAAPAPDKPAVATVNLPDPRLQTIAEHIDTKKIIPAQLKITDIPGLVRGSSEGQGMGNKFLAHIRDVDALCHVVRCFEDPSVAHVDNSVDPARDIETVEAELILADLQTVENALPKAERAARAPDP